MFHYFAISRSYLLYQGKYFENNTAYQIFLCALNCTILENDFHCKFTCHVNIKLSRKIFAKSLTRVSPISSLVVFIDYRLFICALVS